MAVALNELISRTGRKLELLGRRYEQTRSENDALRSEIATLRAENASLQVQLTQARTDLEYLSMSHRIAASPDEIVKARRRVDAMIREIDRCISQLKE